MDRRIDDWTIWSSDSRQDLCLKGCCCGATVPYNCAHSDLVSNERMLSKLPLKTVIRLRLITCNYYRYS
ncbi:hypothetical protein IAQ61_000505 [Plenodomus lingam]|uniref:uncharacterized protein n=1 Tax=Leptosphaeria maculans TaxID=5022 RepID=UPI003322736D|nr:hypothetical protein IAQ61_000505 [Plenodomus lingam]